jgi:NAD(P)-dependent dehydrogenase (short-subunit alcohol dehydrogenase family)
MGEQREAMPALTGRRVVVVGGSSGIGRGVAERAIACGAQVVVAARRVDRLKELVVEAGAGHLVELDLRVDESCQSFVDSVRSALGVVDLLFVSAGVARLKSFRQTGKDDWLRALDTNVIGIHRLIANLLDVFDPHAVVAVVSTEAVDSPRSHLGAYGASKAALEHSLAQWREELPTIRFTTISLGATVPTEFGRGFDPDEIIDAMHKWTEAGRSQSAFMDTNEVCDVLTHTLGSLVAAPSVGVPFIALRAPAAIATDADAVTATALDHRR